MHWSLPLDHLQRLVVILHNDVPAIYICMKLFKAKIYWKTFSFYVCMPSLYICKCFASKRYSPVVLKECSAEAIFTGIGLQDKGFCMVIIGESGLEKHVAYPRFEAIESLVCGGIPVPICYLLSKECSFGSQTGEKGLQVIY